MLFPRHLHNQRGIALLYLVILFTLLGVLVTAGSRMLGSLVTQRNITDSKAELERDVQIITAWSIRNGRLPTAGEYAGVFGAAPQDAWGKALAYAGDSNLTMAASGGICGRSAPAGEEVAFLLVSGGDDMAITSTPAILAGVLTGTAAEDLTRVVTLKELQAKVGCAGSTGGGLRIVNNELPNACSGRKYSATLFGDGGVPPVSFSYTDRPAWLTPTGVRFSTLSGNSITAVDPSYTFGVLATDAVGASVKRTYLLKIIPCL